VVRIVLPFEHMLGGFDIHFRDKQRRRHLSDICLVFPHTINTDPKLRLVMKSVQEDSIRRLGPRPSLPPSVNEGACRINRSDITRVGPVIDNRLKLWNLVWLVHLILLYTGPNIYKSLVEAKLASTATSGRERLDTPFPWSMSKQMRQRDREGRLRPSSCTPRKL
jgi:hypothetical protein